MQGYLFNSITKCLTLRFFTETKGFFSILANLYIKVPEMKPLIIIVGFIFGR